MLQSFLPGINKGGVGYQVVRLAGALAERGHELTIFSFRGNESEAFTLKLPRHGRSLFLSKAGRLTLVPIAFGLHSYKGFDVVHAHGDNHLLVRRNVPVVRTFYGSAREEARHAQRLRRKISQRGFFLCEQVARRTATMTVGISQNAQTSIGGVDAVIPCGVDRSVFHPGEKSSHPSILFVGTIGGRKRGQLLVDLFRNIIKPNVPGCELWLVADRMITGDGILSWSRPSDEEVASLYRRAWLLAHPSTYEGFGVPYIEAMASGTAVVSSGNLGVAELVNSGMPGIIAEDDQFAGAALEMLGDQARRQDVQRTGAEWSAAYGWDVVASKYEAVYELARERLQGGSLGRNAVTNADGSGAP